MNYQSINSFTLCLPITLCILSVLCPTLIPSISSSLSLISTFSSFSEFSSCSLFCTSFHLSWSPCFPFLCLFLISSTSFLAFRLASLLLLLPFVVILLLFLPFVFWFPCVVFSSTVTARVPALVVVRVYTPCTSLF